MVYAVNVGGPLVTLDGVEYKADRFASGGTVNRTTDPIAGTSNASLYQSERYGSVTYEIPVTNATYSVKLHFVEMYQNMAGARSFSVSVEGEPVLQNFDLFAEAGHDTAFELDVPSVMVADSSLTIATTTVLDNATISGFAIYSNDGGMFVEPPEPEPGAAIPSAGCGTSRTLANGTRNIQSSGTNRQYILDVPNNYDNNHPYRLVFGIHAFYGHMDRIADGSEIGGGNPNYAHYGLKQYAGDTTIFVAPNGTGNPNGWPNQDGRQTVFFDDMLRELTSDLCIDESRIFAHGFSYGSGMSYNLACERPEVFRAVGIYGTGDAVISCGTPSAPMAYLGVHGIGDGTFNIRSNGHKYRDRMVQANGCTAMSPPEPNAGSRTHICTSYNCPNEEYPARWCAFDGGHIPAPIDGSTDNHWNTWVAKEAWAFFTQF